MTMQYGVGFGGQGSWYNKHFATLSEAETFYTATITRTIGGFTHFKTRTIETTKKRNAQSKRI